MQKTVTLEYRGLRMTRFQHGNGHWVVYNALGHQIGAVRGIAGQQAAENFIDEYLKGTNHDKPRSTRHRSV